MSGIIFEEEDNVATCEKCGEQLREEDCSCGGVICSACGSFNRIELVDGLFKTKKQINEKGYL